MKNWISKNYKTLIIAAFLVPIITVAIVSISHVTTWYGISNPVTWSVYLSIGIEIAALSALAAISANMGSKVYFPFAIVTLIQFIGNIFFAYTYIDINAQTFKDWVDLVSPLVEFIGVEPTDMVGHKRFLALFAGGMLPIISLSFLHMLVKFTEEDRKKENEIKYNKEVEDKEPENKIDASDLVGEVSRIRLSENDLKKLEEVLLNPPPPNENLVNAAKKYKEEKLKSASLKEESALNDEEILKRAEEIQLKRVFERAEEIEKAREEEFGPINDDEVPTALANSEYRNSDFEDNDWGGLTNEELIGDDEIPNVKEPISWEERGKILSEMMQRDQELGLYDIPVVKPTPTSTPTPTPTSTSTETPIESELEFYSDLSDEEFSNTQPTEEEESQNFSTIEQNSENFFQDKDDVNMGFEIEVESIPEPVIIEETPQEFVQTPITAPINSDELVEKKNP